MTLSEPTTYAVVHNQLTYCLQRACRYIYIYRKKEKKKKKRRTCQQPRDRHACVPSTAHLCSSGPGNMWVPPQPVGHLTRQRPKAAQGARYPALPISGMPLGMRQSPTVEAVNVKNNGLPICSQLGRQKSRRTRATNSHNYEQLPNMFKSTNAPPPPQSENQSLANPNTCFAAACPALPAERPDSRRASA